MKRRDSADKSAAAVFQVELRSGIRPRLSNHLRYTSGGACFALGICSFGTRRRAGDLLGSSDEKREKARIRICSAAREIQERPAKLRRRWDRWASSKAARRCCLPTRTRTSESTLLRTGELRPFTSSEISMLSLAVNTASEQLSRCGCPLSRAFSRKPVPRGKSSRATPRTRREPYVLDSDLQIVLAWSARRSAPYRPDRASNASCRSSSAVQQYVM